MPRSTRPATADLLLTLLESAAERPLDPAQAGRVLRPAFGTFSARRVARALQALQAEGLLSTAEGLRGCRLHPTAAGFDALQRAGRGCRERTILFTDIVDSTREIDTFGELEAHARRTRHFALTARIVETHDGRIVKNLGDGVMVEFASPTDATACAAELQARVAADRDGLELRVGVHTGSLLREGDDLFGTTVIVARRLCDRAAAGEILISEQARAAAGAPVAGATAARPLGSLTLKGLSQPVAAFALWWAQRGEGAATSGPLVTA